MFERATTTVAAGAVSSPWWLPSLSSISETAGLLLPILGCTWLIVQIILKITRD
jgi:hypothetical protein